MNYLDEMGLLLKKHASDVLLELESRIKYPDGYQECLDKIQQLRVDIEVAGLKHLKNLKELT